MRKALFLLWIFVCVAAVAGQDATEGSLFAVGKDGKEWGACPLKTTAVKADISGFMARVTVRQEFENRFGVPIEAVYVFPLSDKGAVDRMTMTVGSRVITGKIMRREEARATYEAAKIEGKTAALLDQERDNIFTQSVANIMPGDVVIVEISYVETLKYEDGAYEFVFPMTVAPRYTPAGVPDASKIAAPIAPTRAGHDISVEVDLNAGVPVEDIRSTSHDIDQVNFTPALAKVKLRDEKTIPNKDFVLRYDVTGKRIEDAMLTHRGQRGGFFTMILQPPDKIATEDRTPKEIVFVLDTSGSMSGFPIEKAKEAMQLSLDGLYPEDTFNLITFAGDTHILFDEPVPATQANLERARQFLSTRQGSGGTEMMTAIKAALDPSDSKQHVRIACFMTDGVVGNDDEIVAEVQRHPNARVFAFGIGSSVNRSLLDRMAKEGKGEVDYVGLSDDGSKAARKFYDRVRTPLLTDLRIEWNSLPVADVFPDKLTDLFSAKPVIVHGRFTKAASGSIKLRGNIAGQPYERDIAVDLPQANPANDVLATLWARTRIDSLTSSRLKATTPAAGAAIDKQITDLGLDFGLMTNFTSFVAVEDRVVNQNGRPTTIQVPVELPEGMAREGLFMMRADRFGDPNGASATGTGGGGGGGRTSAMVTVTASKPPARRFKVGSVDRSSSASGQGSGRGTGYGSGDGSGSGGGLGCGVGYGSGSGTVSSGGFAPPPPPKVVSGGILNGKAVRLAKPMYPEAARSMNAQGNVSVRVLIDESGKVVQATPISGLPLFQAAAANAAKNSTFAPTILSGQPVKVSGVITYNFTIGGPSEPVVGNLVPATPEVVAAIAADPYSDPLKAKLHAWLYALAMRLAKPEAPPGPNESLFIRDGRADVTIELTARTPEIIAKLTALGFGFSANKGKAGISGSIPATAVASLVEIDEVILVLPRM